MGWHHEGEVFQNFQQSNRVIDQYGRVLHDVEVSLKEISKRFSNTDNQNVDALGKSLGENLKTAAMTTLTTTGKLALITSALTIAPNTKRSDLVDIIPKVWIKEGKFASTWEKFLKHIKTHNTPEKMFAGLANLDKSLPGNSIRADNITKHIRNTLKPFGLAGVAIGGLSEVSSLTAAIKSDMEQYDGLKAGLNIATDSFYSTGKVISNLASSYGGAAGGAELGAMIGSLPCFLPPIGTAVGGIAGAIVGSAATGTASNMIFDNVLPRKRFKDFANKITSLI
ncbi:WXG100 family type VII secretion target [Ectobacillus sp. JY-23]|uniref:WXG100 family type VII secretion target n=1 Tax=Ectobacillus sp. JY-23 TaxID=2933872 RepID=UPI001FF42EB5|nr:WXG100 family type VII secretion target [Ectobacillus sp. JY-23]UOY92397.1 WXG100 family type VII secretion target [Ectobacillus sp. JY-23]